MKPTINVEKISEPLNIWLNKSLFVDNVEKKPPRTDKLKGGNGVKS